MEKVSEFKIELDSNSSIMISPDEMKEAEKTQSYKIIKAYSEKFIHELFAMQQKENDELNKELVTCRKKYIDLLEKMNLLIEKKLYN